METMSDAEFSAILDAIPVDGEQISGPRLAALVNALPDVEIKMNADGTVDGVFVTGLMLRIVDALSVVVGYAAEQTGSTREAVIFDLRNGDML